MWRDIAILLAMPIALIVAGVAWWRPWQSRFEPAPGTTVFDVATGRWDRVSSEDFCGQNPHVISFSSDRKLMRIEHDKPWTDSTGKEYRVTEYDVHEVTKNRIRGQIRGETRMTPQGAPVVWDLILTSADRYHWHRADWPFWGITNVNLRCPGTLIEGGVPRASTRASTTDRTGE